ncbi:MAG TPA: hypothetical protein VHC22_00535 [Pirellulales bacterium]|nr:hypothetical protein [Pirellulales bacterium]
MSILDQLERRFGRFAIPQLTLVLTCAQVIGFLLITADPNKAQQLFLSMDRVVAGEFWRLGTFFFMPVAGNPICFALALYFFYMTGTTLEANWGHVRYNLYIAIGTLATMGVAALYPQTPVTNAFIGTSVFLAFAHLYPNFVISLYFLLPIRIRWLALFTWIGYVYVLTFGSIPDRLMVLASVSNFLLFFGKEIFTTAKDHKRRMEWEAKRLRRPDKPFHNCAICGANERTHPKMDFRYCTKCVGSYEYCADHLRTHEHVVKPTAMPAPTAGAQSDAEA